MVSSKMTTPLELKIKANEKDNVTALLYLSTAAKRGKLTIILGHGAGAGQLSPFMQLFAHGLAQRGADVLTFNFVYMEQRRGAPDPKLKLEACYSAVIATALNDKRLKENRLIVGGKSMGGRIASQVVAADSKGIDGLVCLGYPLHPPGNLTKLRVEHLPAIRVPVLFVQGTRDTFGSPDEIRSHVKSLKPKPDFFEIEGGDHSFKAPKSAKLTQQEVYDQVMDKIISWARG